MGKPILTTEGNTSRAKLILAELMKEDTYEHYISGHDRAKIHRIKTHLDSGKGITAKQFRTITHYSKVYKIKINQSIDFILD